MTVKVSKVTLSPAYATDLFRITDATGDADLCDAEEARELLGLPDSVVKAAIDVDGRYQETFRAADPLASGFVGEDDEAAFRAELRRVAEQVKTRVPDAVVEYADAQGNLIEVSGSTVLPA